MSVTYHKLLRQIAHRAGMLRGEQTFGLETSYIVDELSTGELVDNGPYPLQSMKDALLQAEEDFAWAIAATGNHPMRTALAGVTSSMTSPANLPVLSSANKQIIGSWGAVYDAADGHPLTEKPLDVILRRNRTGNHYVTPVYFFKIDGRRLYHTRPTVIIEVCVYDRAAQETALEANDPMLLTDVLEPGLVARALGYLPRLQNGPAYRAFSEDVIAGIKVGVTSMVPKSIPLPVTEAVAK